MPKTVPVEVRVADLPQMQQFISSAAVLLRELAKCQVRVELPETVLAAADQLRNDVAALAGVADAADMPSDEDRIRDAMTEAQDHPGRIITR